MKNKEKIKTDIPVTRKITPEAHMRVLEQCVALALTTRQLERVEVPSYQRDVIPSIVTRLTQAMLNNEIIPPVMLLYKPEKNGGVSFEEALNFVDERLENIVFTIIDGHHRALAAIAAGMPLGAYCVPSKMRSEEETQTFIRLQYGQRVNSNHLVAIDNSMPENRWVVKLATEKDSPLYGKIYLGKGKKQPDQINAVNFTQLVSRKMITAEELWDFSVFYAKVFLGNRIYSGGFKGCALLWKYLKDTDFDLMNPEHIAVLKRFDWTDPDNLYASKLNSNEDSKLFGDRLIKVWTDYEKESGK